MESPEECLRKAEKILDAFKTFDANNDGYITMSELSHVLQELDPQRWTDENVRCLLSSLDRNHNGTIEYGEMITFVCDDKKDSSVKSHLLDAVPDEVKKRKQQKRLEAERAAKVAAEALELERKKASARQEKLRRQARREAEEEALARKRELAATAQLSDNMPDALVEEMIMARLSVLGGLEGDPHLTLIWDTLDDLDLHCVTPNGNEISYNKRQFDGGMLDVDANGHLPRTERPVENIFWSYDPNGPNDQEQEPPPHGEYRVFLHMYFAHSHKKCNWAVRLKVYGAAKIVRGHWVDGDPIVIEVAKFIFDGAKFKEGHVATDSKLDEKRNRAAFVARGLTEANPVAGRMV